MTKYEEMSFNFKKQIELLKQLENLLSKSNATNRQETSDSVRAFRQDIEKAQMNFKNFSGGTHNHEKDI